MLSLRSVLDGGLRLQCEEVVQFFAHRVQGAQPHPLEFAHALVLDLHGIYLDELLVELQVQGVQHQGLEGQCRAAHHQHRQRNQTLPNHKPAPVHNPNYYKSFERVADKADLPIDCIGPWIHIIGLFRC